MDIVYLIGGLILILWGADALTDGASAIAKKLNISDLVIGLTIVSFGTSAPEFVISLISSLKGSSDIAIGNIVGSNISNTLLIVGLTATIFPLAVQKSTIKTEIPLSLLAGIVLFFMGSDILLKDGTSNIIGRGDGLILLCFFAIFMGYSLNLAKNNKNEETETPSKSMKTIKAIILLILGLCALIFGGQFFVDGASNIARSLGVSESVIGLTLVAIGTSLPELATSVVAAFKKSHDMAIGNIVGSNIFNIFAILGISASINPMQTTGITTFDYGMLILSGVLLFIFALFFGKRKITRIEGILLLIVYIGYMIYLVK